MEKRKTVEIFARFDGYITVDAGLLKLDQETAVLEAIKAGKYSIEPNGYVTDGSYEIDGEDTHVEEQEF